MWGDTCSQTELDAAFAKLDSHFDPNGDGKIDLVEFKEALVKELGTLPSTKKVVADAHEYAEGNRVEAKCGNWIKFFPGTVQNLNEDGTYFVKFDDGELRDVQESEMPYREFKQSLDTEKAAVALQATTRRGAKRAKKRRNPCYAK